MSRAVLVAAMAAAVTLSGCGRTQTPRPQAVMPPTGAPPRPAPGNDLVLYYGDQAYFPGIVILGRIDETTAQRISAIDGPVTATIEVPGDWTESISLSRAPLPR